MGVRTQRRAWMVRAAVVVVASAAGAFGFAAPAFADDPQLTDITVEPGTIAPGQQTRVRFKVTNPDPDPRTITVRVTSSDNKVGCIGACVFTNQSFGGEGQPNRFRDYDLRFGASGAIQQDLQVTLTISAKDDGAGPEVQQGLNVDAPDQAASVPEVSGTVADTTTGKGIAAAKVFLQDSATPVHQYEVGTDSSGRFKFTAADGPIAPGTIALRVEKEGFAPYDRTVQGQPGVPLRVPKMALAPTTSATPSAAPTVGPSGSAEPTLGAINGDPTSGNEEEAGLSWLLIAIGGVLVLLGIGAIVLLLVRRNRDDDEDDEDAAPPRRGPPPGRGGPPRPQQPPRRGAPPERTTVMRGGPPPMGPPVSPGPRGADQTMIARSPLADMPTQMHRPLPVDPDPYATRQNGAHAAPHYPGGPGPAGGYGPPPYGGPPPAGYPGPGPGYGPPDPQYGQPYPGGGPAYPGGYEQPTYGQPYGQQPPPTPPYDPQAGYDPYDPRDPRDPRGQRPPGQEGRRVDWLDD